jgi:hypothetical protein
MGGKKATTTSQVSIPPEVLARYNAVNTRAETAAAKPFQAFGNTAADYIAQMNAQQGAGISDINTTAGSYQPYMDKATTATQAGMGPAYEGIDNYMSPYIKNVADATGAYMRQQQEQSQSGALGTAISSGAFGGDRAGIAAANLQQQNQMGYGKTMADILNQGYTQALGASQADLARQLQGGSQMAGLGAQSQQLGLQGAQAKIAAGTMQQQTEQAGKDAMINRFMQEQGLQYQQAQFLANIAMGTGAASGSTTTTTSPLGIFGNLATGGRVEGYADGGGVSGPRTYTQSGVGSEGYVPAGDLPVGQLMVANPPDQQQSNGTDEIIKLIAMMGGGAKRGGAIDQRHGYATDGSVEDLGNRIRLDDALLEQFGGVKPVVSDGRDGELPSSRKVLGDNPQYLASRVLSPLTTEQLRNNINDPDYYDLRGFQTARNLANARNQEDTNPANMGYGKGYNMGMVSLAHPYPPSPTTGVAPAPIAALQVTPEDDAARRAMMAKALGAREPRASQRYMLPTTTGVVAPPVNAIKELNLGAGDPFGAYTESARPPVVSEKPPTISSRSPASLTSPDGGKGGIRLLGADVTSPILPSSPPLLAGLAGADLASPISQSPPPYPDGLSGADVAADALRTIKVEPALSDRLSGDNFARASSEAPTDWDAAKAKIIPRESGNDPNALLGFANREGGAFAGTNITDMTVNQAIEFSRVGGPYANYSKTQTEDGRVATPMGLYQIVGDTLKGAAAEMGLTGNEVMTPELQERIAKHLYDTYGMKPWAASEGKTGGLGGGTADGLGGANMAQQRGGLFNPDKPYDQRNFLGKFFRNPDGSMNQNALLSVLIGLGKGAEAQTISPLGGILSGIGSGAEAYKGLVKQTADVEATNLANVQNAMKNYSYAVYNGMTDMSWPEYAAQQGIDLTALRGVPTLMGQPPVDPITVADTRSFVTRNVNGVDIKIPFMQDFQSLNDLINQNIGAQSDPSNPMSSVVAQAIARRDEIAKTGTTVGKDQFGNDVVYKDPTAFGAITTESERQAAVGRNERFGASSEAFSSSAPVVDSSINELTNILTTIAPGITNPLIALGDSLGSAFGLTSGDYAAKTQAALAKALEPMIADAISGNMTGPAAEALAQVRSQLMSPTMQPGAVRDSIATARAVIDYQRQAYDEYYNKGGQNAPDVMGDPMKFMQKYEKEHPFAEVKEKYMDYHVTPPLLGEPAPPEYLAVPNTSQDQWNSYSTQTKIEMLDKIAEQAAANQGG